jgi:hypothetical protein
MLQPGGASYVSRCRIRPTRDGEFRQRVSEYSRPRESASVAELQSAAIPERPEHFRVALTSLISAVETSLSVRGSPASDRLIPPKPISGRMPHRTRPLDSVRRAAGSRHSAKNRFGTRPAATRPFPYPPPVLPPSGVPVNFLFASSSSPLPRNIVIL